jgi:erythromycin esterase
MLRTNAEPPAGEVVREVRRRARPLRGVDDLTPLLERIGKARIVMLGEASHGTSDYYTWRTRISMRLILEHGFSFVAVEGDWPACYRVNRFVRGSDGSGGEALDVLATFRRWPTWMWANWEVVALTQWLRRHNDALPEDRRVGFYGLDVYSLWESLAAIEHYLEETDPAALAAARSAFDCFEPFGEDAAAYARATALVPVSCEAEVVELLRAMRSGGDTTGEDREARFDADQNARSAVGAERYYRAMVRGGSESWNVRDRHMMGTLEDLLEHHGAGSRAIVWEHNTHIGDARATDMAAVGMINVGQLARERYGEQEVVLVGFGSHRGTVIAAPAWGAASERMQVPVAREASWEDVFHEAVAGDAFLLTADLSASAAARRGHRAIGVVYDPRQERYGNFVATDLPQRYDAFVYLDESDALHPLDVDARRGVPPDTFPWGV